MPINSVSGFYTETKIIREQQFLGGKRSMENISTECENDFGFRYVYKNITILYE